MIKTYSIILLLSTIVKASIINIPADQATIQAGIDVSISGDTVLVSPGTYLESINFIGKNIVVMSAQGMDSTIIQGDSTQRVVTFESGEGPEAMLIGFTIENGNGGILCRDYSDPIIYQCKIRHNNATIPSGTYFGLSGGGGGAIIHSAPLIINTAIYQNESSLMGGGIYLEYSSARLVNVVVYGNQAIAFDGIFYLGSPNSIIQNSIIWENNLGPSTFGNSINVLHSNILEGWPGEGNIDQQPQFVDAENGNFNLVPTSPCINAGQSGFLFNDGDGTVNDMGLFGGSGFFMDIGDLFFGQIVMESYITYPLKIYNLLALPISMLNISLSNPELISTNINFPLSLTSKVNEVPITISPEILGIDSCELAYSLTDGINTETLGIIIRAEGVATHGQHVFRRIGTLDAGLVATRFKNHGEITDYPNQPSCEWPKGSGHDYMDGIAFIIQAETEDNSGNIIHPMETQYREFVDSSPWGDPWGWEPDPGYMDPMSNTLAMSTIPETWPAHWPNKGSNWDGYWNGFLGKGVMDADQETYFVFDDYQDQEWDFNPVGADPARGGLGLQVEARGYAWDNPQFEDVLIWHYSIHNISDYDYQQVVLGLYLDVGVGGVTDGNDDLGISLPDENMVYFYDTDGIGMGGWSPVGYLGIRFLEMPGNHSDGIDNDSDGLIDESRDNNIDDDGDWNPQTDDVGGDGIAGTYDIGESDGIPTDGEPNFDKTDQDESDDVDINTIRFFQIHDYQLRDDEENWQVFTSGVIDSTSVAGHNVGSFVITESFPLASGESTYFSYAIIFGEDLEDMLSNAGSISPLRLEDGFNPKQPHTTKLYPNFPNPFNPSTTISYSLPEQTTAELTVFNIRGQEVMTLLNADKPPGNYEVQWNGLDHNGNQVSTGVYFARLHAGHYSKTIKMVYLK